MPVADAKLVLYDREDAVAFLTLNRPETRNALSLAMMMAFEEKLSRAVEDEVHVLVVRANGPVFCAGHDLKELLEHPGRQFYDRVFALCSHLMRWLAELPQPVIAQVQGPATAAGCQLVAAADLAVASKDARFCTPGVNIGLFCSTPMVALTRNVPPKAALEMLFTGDWVEAEAALRLGLVNKVVAPESLAEETRRLARRIAEKPPRVLRLGKAAYYRQRGLDLEAAYRAASEIMIKNMMLPEAREGISAFLEKRRPDWTKR
jgi:enoyl-CoA hydratase/carnithine racemase